MSERTVILRHPDKPELRHCLEGSVLTLRVLLDHEWEIVAMFRPLPNVANWWVIEDQDGSIIDTQAEIWERLGIRDAYGQLERHPRKP